MRTSAELVGNLSGQNKHRMPSDKGRTDRAFGDNLESKGSRFIAGRHGSEHGSDSRLKSRGLSVDHRKSCGSR